MQPNGGSGVYDAEGRMCAESSVPISGGVAMVQYLYDAEGNRVAKGTIQPVLVNGQQTISCDTTINGFTLTNQYLLGQAGEQVAELDQHGIVIHTNAYAGGSLIATWDNNGEGIHFHLTDWLGSRRVQTNYAGVVENTWTSLPFGDGLTASKTSDATEQHFTGKERDAESGLDYFGARYYGSNMGRMMSPDSGVDQHPEDPQSWNLYTYVRNNPLRLVDPTGEYVCGDTVSKTQCDNFQKSLDSAQDRANALKDKYGADDSRYTDAQRAIDAYGKQNVDNGVTLQVGNTGGWMGNTDVSGNTVTPTKDNPNGQQITVTFGAGTFDGSSGSGLDAAHEGSHVADGSAYVSSGFNPAMNPTNYATEFRAFQVQANLASATGYTLIQLPPGVKDAITVYQRGFTPQQVTGAINNLLNQGYSLTPNDKTKAFIQNTKGGH